MSQDDALRPLGPERLAAAETGAARRTRRSSRCSTSTPTSTWPSTPPLRSAVTGWVLPSQGLAAATAQAFGSPALFLAVVVVTVLSAGRTPWPANCWSAGSVR